MKKYVLVYYVLGQRLMADGELPSPSSEEHTWVEGGEWYIETSTRKEKRFTDHREAVREFKELVKMFNYDMLLYEYDEEGRESIIASHDTVLRKLYPDA